MADHYAATHARLKEDGQDDAAAERMTIELLGKPEVIAASAADTLHKGCWMARRPFLFSLSFGLFILALYALLAFACMQLKVLVDRGELHSLAAAETSAILLNWIPLSGGLILLAWAGLRYSLGWKPLLVASIALGLAVTAFGFWKVGAWRSTRHYMIYGDGFSSPDFVNLPWAIFTGEKHWPAPDALFVMRLLLPLALCLAIRHSIPRLRLPEG